DWSSDVCSSDLRSGSKRLSYSHVDSNGGIAVMAVQRSGDIKPYWPEAGQIAQATANAYAQILRKIGKGFSADIAGVGKGNHANGGGDAHPYFSRTFDQRAPAGNACRRVDADVAIGIAAHRAAAAGKEKLVRRRLGNRRIKQCANLRTTGQNKAAAIIKAVIRAGFRNDAGCRVAIIEFVIRLDCQVGVKTFGRVSRIVAGVVGKTTEKAGSHEITRTEHVFEFIIGADSKQ